MTDQEIKDIFVKRVRHHISLCGKQQKEIASDLGIPPTTFNNWCTGRILPKISDIDKLAKYFNVPRSDFLYEAGADTKSKLLFEIDKMDDERLKRLLDYLYYLKQMDIKDEN